MRLSGYLASQQQENVIDLTGGREDTRMKAKVRIQICSHDRVFTLSKGPHHTCSLDGRFREVRGYQGSQGVPDSCGDVAEVRKCSYAFRRCAGGLLAGRWESGQFHLGQFQDECFKLLSPAEKKTRCVLCPSSYSCSHPHCVASVE